MKFFDLKYRYGLFVLIQLTVVTQFSCTSQTPAEEGRQVLQEAALAMGGLEALGAIDNITRIGTRQISSFGHGRLGPGFFGLTHAEHLGRIMPRFS